MGNPLSMEMPFAESKGAEYAGNADHSWACQVPGPIGTIRKLGESSAVRKFQMGAEDGYWLTFECKSPAVLGKNCLGQPLPIADFTLPLPPPIGQESEALALFFKKEFDL